MLQKPATVLKEIKKYADWMKQVMD